jgi:dihydroorotate dehydrogenase electron transfer subunit
MRQRTQTVEGRPGEGPVRATCEVLARRREGEYFTLSFSSPEIADRARPGQFVNIAVEAPGTVLRRPFSISRVSKAGPAAGTVDVVFDAHGPGTEWLTELDSHDIVDVIGPLGSPFPLPRQKVPCLLIGGGYGVAPLFMLAEDLTREGMRVDMIVGAASMGRLYNVIEAKRITASVAFTTEDGTYGTRGRVTDVLPDLAASSGAGVVYACGPMPMLRAVSEVCAELELPCQVAVEEHMACGVGICWTCVVPVRGKPGDDGEPGLVHMRRACIDGPVFNGSRIAWDVSRWVTGPAAEPEEEEEVVPTRRLTEDELWGDA